MTLCLFILLVLIKGSGAASRIQVTVDGVEGDVKQNVLSFLEIEQQKDFEGLSDYFIHELHEKAPDEIRSALQPFGYYNPHIKSSLELVEGTWHATYGIDKGEPVVVREFDFRITGEGTDDTIFKKSPLKKGDIFRHEAYEDGKQRLQQAALVNGYFNAVLTGHGVRVYPDENAADVMIHFDTGPRYLFGDVIFTHQDILRPEFLQRFVPFRKGSPYSTASIFQLRNSLRASGYFSEIEVQALNNEAEGREIPVKVTLVPAKRNRYSFGVGYGTDTGVRGSVGWEDRYINRQGHKMNAELRLSEIEENLATRYIIPLKKPETEHLDFTAGWARHHSLTVDRESVLAGAGLNHAWKSWTRTVYLNFQHENFDVADQSGRTFLLLPGFTLTRVVADNRIYTTRGSRIVLDVKGAHTALLSDVSLLQAVVQGKLIYGIGDSGRSIFRGKAGSTAVKGFGDLPASLRFFAGGDQSVRGYAYNTLGPVNDDGDVIGGRHILEGSAEYEQKITGTWGAAVFYDIGNAFNTLTEPFKQGTGVGVRWHSPVGLVRLDFAHALEKTGTSWRIHISIGPDL